VSEGLYPGHQHQSTRETPVEPQASGDPQCRGLPASAHTKTSPSWASPDGGHVEAHAGRGAALPGGDGPLNLTSFFPVTQVYPIKS